MSSVSVFDASLGFPIDALLDEDRALVRIPEKRGGDGREEPTGMWFGPRLGKRNKRSFDVPWTIFTVPGKFIFSPPEFCKDLSTSPYTENPLRGFINPEAF
jgi:hypothetical protein